MIRVNVDLAGNIVLLRYPLEAPLHVVFERVSHRDELCIRVRLERA